MDKTVGCKSEIIFVGGRCKILFLLTMLLFLLTMLLSPFSLKEINANYGEDVWQMKQPDTT